MSNNTLFIGQLEVDKTLTLRASDLISFTTDLQTVNYLRIKIWFFDVHWVMKPVVVAKILQEALIFLRSSGVLKPVGGDKSPWSASCRILAMTTSFITW